MGESFAEKARPSPAQKMPKVPRLSDAQVTVRAAKAYDIAQRNVIAKNFVAAPPRKELASLMSFISPRQHWKDADGNLDLRRIVKAYSQKNPQTVIARYYKATDTANWLVTPSNKIGFNREVLQKEAAEALSVAKKSFVATAVWLNQDPKRRSKNLDARQLASRMPSVMPQLQQQLMAQVQAKATKLPLTIAYKEPEFTLNSTLKRGATAFNLES